MEGENGMRWESRRMLANGEMLVLRSLTAQDAPAGLELTKKTSAETRNMSRYPDEVRMSEEQEAAFLQSVLENPRALVLGAFLSGQLIGMCSVLPIGPQERLRHRGGLGISVLRAYWHRGVATALMENCIRAAEEAGIEQIELDVVSTNARARAIYERLGFQIFGLNRRAMKYRDGTYADLILMRLDLISP